MKSEHNKKTDSSFDWRDSEDTQASTDRPRSPVFRTKAAMKEFSFPDATRAKDSTTAGSATAGASSAVTTTQQPLTPTTSRSSKKSRQQTKQQLQLSRDSSASDLEADDDSKSQPLMQIVPQRSAARKANQKLNKKGEPIQQAGVGSADDKKSGRGSSKAAAGASKTSDLFDDDSDDSESENRLRSGATQVTSSLVTGSLRKSPRAKHGSAIYATSDISDQEDVEPKTFPLVMNSSIKDEPKSKLNQKSKKGEASPLPVTMSSVFSDSDDDNRSILSLPSTNNKSSTLSRQLAAKHNSRTKKPILSQPDDSPAQDIEFDSLFNTLNSDSDEEYRNKKRVFDDFENPETFTFVPQRKAAKKASEQLREQDLWKKNQQVAYQAIIAKQQEDKAAIDPVKKLIRGRQGSKQKKGSAAPSESDNEVYQRRTRSTSSSSSSSTSASESGKSPRARVKSPKGKQQPSTKTQSPRTAKPVTAKKVRNKKSPRRPEGSISSSKALEYLSQRESQISNILGNYNDKAGGETVRTGKEPDKKLKTSEGRPEGLQSPPSSTKNSSDSETDSSSDDSTVAKIKSSILQDSNREEGIIQQPAPGSTPASNSIFSPSHEMGAAGGGAGTPLAADEQPGKADHHKLGGRRGNFSDSSLDRGAEQTRRSSVDDFASTPPHLFAAPPSGGSSFRDRKSSISSQQQNQQLSSPAKTPTLESQQFKQSPQTFGRSPAAGSTRGDRENGSQKSLFSPERSPRVPPISGQSPATGFRSREHEPLLATSQKENEVPGQHSSSLPASGQWKSPRERKAESVAATPPSATTKSPRLSGSYFF